MDGWMAEGERDRQTGQDRYERHGVTCMPRPREGLEGRDGWIVEWVLGFLSTVRWGDFLRWRGKSAVLLYDLGQMRDSYVGEVRE